MKILAPKNEKRECEFCQSGLYTFSSCKEAAKEVLISVYLSVCPQVENLACMKDAEGSSRFLNESFQLILIFKNL